MRQVLYTVLFAGCLACCSLFSTADAVVMPSRPAFAAQADAYFVLPILHSYRYEEQGLTIGFCPQGSAQRESCRTFSELAKEHGCTLTGIAVNDHTENVIVYCQRNIDK